MITFVNTVPISATRSVNRFALIRNFAGFSGFDAYARQSMFKILGEDKVGSTGMMGQGGGAGGKDGSAGLGDQGGQRVRGAGVGRVKMGVTWGDQTTPMSMYALP